jgi:hypothetical protein
VSEHGTNLYIISKGLLGCWLLWLKGMLACWQQPDMFGESFALRAAAAAAAAVALPHLHRCSQT